jgi:hypothetical protein
MSSLRALKRKSMIKLKSNNKEISSTSSLPNLIKTKKELSSLKRSKSESDIRNLNPSTTNKKDLKLHAKSERNLESLYNSKFTTSTPLLSSPISPTAHINMQNSSFSVITDADQIKIPIVGYEVMEERSRFTVSFSDFTFCYRLNQSILSDIQTTR